ncbi:conjugal transfer protein [Mammaliicoccus sp. B-M10]|uniref:conjugal transfer protein n=1 Tax=Mammaliicoccus sp. B-M10 TaxID=2898670 RepID=UPI001EFAA815|nr:conjugal transfer protein [Mammaliicoccus sp. B-M10]
MKFFDKTIQPIKSYFSQFNRKKKKEFKLKPKFTYKRVFKWLIWFVLIIALLLMVLSIYKANVAYQAFKDNGDISSKWKEVQAKEKKSITNDPKNKVFTENYIDRYMNIPEEDEQRKERDKNLNEMTANGLEYEPISWRGSRKLNSKEFFDSELKGDVLINKYIVDYDSTTIKETPKEVEKEVKDGKKKKKVTETKMVEEKKHKHNKMILNVAIKGGGGSFKVVESPYFTTLPNLNKDNVSAVENSMVNETSINHEEVKQFTKDFFKDYTSKSLDDMKYIMAQPESMKGQMELENIKTMDIYKQKDKFIVKSTVLLKDEGLDNPHEENFTLVIKKEKDNYKVEKLEHTIGKEDE